jgi:hypothetical protein
VRAARFGDEYAGAGRGAGSTGATIDEENVPEFIH